MTFTFTDEEKRLLAAIKVLEDQYRHQLETGGHWLGISVNMGWLPIVRALFERIERELTPFELKRFRWAQVKQKYGALRAYYHLDGKLSRLHVDLVSPGVPSEHLHIVQGKDEPLASKVDRIIASVAEEASQTCEVCGERRASKVVKNHWISVLCPQHAKE